jgi:DNA polymerase V
MRAPCAIGHLDADCFYVSAERVRDPFLHAKPVGVLGNQGACIIAKSYEMKAAGVHTGEPIWEAVRKCPEGVYVKRDFRWYEVLSRQMLDVVRQLSPRVEYYSIDEFFLEAEAHPAFAQEIQNRILQTAGVPVTIGVARTKTLAKLFSDTAKPFGAKVVLGREAERALLAALPVTEITGVAKRRAAKLAAHNIHTCLDLADADRRFIRSLLTVVGEALWYELNGDPVQPIQTQRPSHKAIARGGSIGKATADPAYLWAWLVRCLERLVEELDFYQVQPGRLIVEVVYERTAGTSGQIDVDLPTDRFDLLVEAVGRAYRQALVPGLKVSHLHIIAVRLEQVRRRPCGLFEAPDEQAQAIAKVKREINARCGRFAVRSGATLPLYEAYRDAAQSYDICDVRGKMCF